MTGPEPRVIAAIESALEPRIAVVIPVWRQSQFVGEAIGSALAASEPVDGAIVVVNDGCPYPSSELNALRMREAARDRIAYIAQPNAGLSAARNTGIRHALEAWPSLRALFMLDADNELGPRTLELLWGRLEAEPEAAWAYPYRQMFDAEGGGWGVPGPFNSYRQLFENQCDAGSLVRREVFEAGVHFDETMRSGYEDWEFFIRAMRRGLVGVPAGHCDFRYRRRHHSMVAASMDRHERVFAQIRRRHPEAYEARELSVNEHAELPRFAMVELDTGTVALGATTDLAPRRCAWAEFDLSDFDGGRDWPPAPPITVLATAETFTWLRRERTLGATLLSAQRRLRALDSVGVRLLAGGGAEPLSRTAEGNGPLMHAAVHRTASLAQSLRQGGGIAAPTAVIRVCWGDSRSMPAPLALEQLALLEPAASAGSPPAGRTRWGAEPHATFAARLHIDRFETTYPWAGGSSGSVLAGFVLASEAGLRPELLAWLAALRRAEPRVRLHLVLVGSSAAAPGEGISPDLFETVFPIDPADPAPAELIAVTLRSADVLITADCELAGAAVALLRPEAIVVDASSPVARGEAGFPGGGQIEIALELEPLVDLFLVRADGAARLANLNVIAEKIVELPTALEQPGRPADRDEAGRLICDALSGVPPRPEAA